MSLVLTYNAAYSTKAIREPRLRLVKFGDGYEQAAPDAINHNLLKLDVRFQGDTATITAINAFLEARGGFEEFLWTAPEPYNDKQRLWRMKKWDRSIAEWNNESISGLIEEVLVVIP